MEKKLQKDVEEKMQSALNACKHEMGMIRTGRASAALFDDIKVECYGTQTPLNQIASISVPEPRLINIQPWDKSIMDAIEKAILKSGLDLSPIRSGNTLRIPFPSLSEERRKELVRVIHKVAEGYRIEVRNLRRDAREQLKSLEKEGKISEDESSRAQEEMQKTTDHYTVEIDRLLATKEKEIMEV